MTPNGDNPYRSPPDPAAAAGAPWAPPGIDLSRAIRLSGTVTRDDCRHASRLIIPDTIVIGMALLLGGTSILASYVVFSASLGRMELLLLATVAGLSGAVTITVMVLRFVLARQLWNLTGDNPIRRWLGESAIRTDTPTGTATEAWSRYDRYAKCEQMLVLREAAGRHLILPRSHCASDSDWQALTKLVESKVPLGRWGLIWR